MSIIKRTENAPNNYNSVFLISYLWSPQPPGLGGGEVYLQPMQQFPCSCFSGLPTPGDLCDIYSQCVSLSFSCANIEVIKMGSVNKWRQEHWFSAPSFFSWPGYHSPTNTPPHAASRHQVLLHRNDPQREHTGFICLLLQVTFVLFCFLCISLNVQMKPQNKLRREKRRDKQSPLADFLRTNAKVMG